MQKESFLTVNNDSSYSFVIEKSKFICYLKHVESEDDARSFITEIKKKHFDATHNCSAFIADEFGQIARFSDDGEPQGTAGMPILEVIKREGLAGVCVVVTRYFGGILLGAGGLVRAYAKGAKIGIDKAGIAEFVEHVTFDISVSYGDYDKVMKDLEKNKVLCRNTEFADVVRLSLSCEQQNLQAFENYIADLTNGKGKCVITGNVYAPKTE